MKTIHKYLSSYVCKDYRLFRNVLAPLRIMLYIWLFLLGWSCAQQGAPTGGPRDEDPPVVLECEPDNYSTRFTANKVAITFDEFVVLDNVNQQLVVSPPMEEQPEVRLRKKTLILEFTDTLKDNTTYTFNFGSSIKDLHEGNVLLNYEYVFSTGDVLDSLSVKGTLKIAEDLSVPEEPITIMLYDDLRDSVPLTDIPLYVGRSDDSGVFSVNNLRPDVYKVFALKDGNYNLLFDLPTEQIGFLDSSLIVNAEFARDLLIKSGMIDTTVVEGDTIYVEKDSAAIEIDTLELIETDSLGMEQDSAGAEIPPGPDLNSIYIDLMLFTEESEIQYITDYSRDDRKKMEMVFARPLTDTFRYSTLMNEGKRSTRLLEYFNPSRDSLTLWIMDSTEYKKDTLILEINYTIKDTTNQYVTQSDTLLFTYRERSETRKRKEEVKEEKLMISTIRKNNEHDLNRNLPITLNHPLKEIDDSLIYFYQIPDSVEVEEPYTMVADTLLLTRAWLMADWESASQYRLLILPGAISGIYGLEHDTLDVPFKTKDMEYYGQILLNLENVRNRILVQLISREKVVRQIEADTPGLYTLPFLYPQDYTIKFIHDLNMNGKWDTGNYLRKLQPEPVELLPSTITVRSNWDHEVTMILEK